MDATPGVWSRPVPALSLVMPAYNEERVIERAIREADDSLRSLFPEYEILVVDDGSTDATAEVATSLKEAYPRLHVLGHESNRGYGAALRTGFEAARSPLVAFTDSDCQFDLADLGPLAAATVGFPIVVGYRTDRQDSFRRRLLSRGYNLLARWLLGTRVRDCDCALKVFQHAALRNLLPESRGFFANSEMLTRARQQGYPLLELPVRHRPRAGGRSKVALAEVPRTLRILVPFWWREVVWGPSAKPMLLTARIGVDSADRLPAATRRLGFGPARPVERCAPLRESV